MDQLAELTSSPGRVLIILVLNRPEIDQRVTVNEPLRKRIHALSCVCPVAPSIAIYRLNDNIDILCVDTEQMFGTIDSKQGVGRARKIGCDTALAWIANGKITSRWIGSTDADAILPADYCQRLGEAPQEAAALLLPFLHRPTGDSRNIGACLLYELSLHHYVVGLKHAGSPYAFHTLGSCLAVAATHYAQVRGFPQRSAAEDFYLLNKLAKTGSVIQLPGKCISLSGRVSDRVPFGTGPAVQQLINASAMENERLYYHPSCFRALAMLLKTINTVEIACIEELHAALKRGNLPADIIQVICVALDKLGIESAIEHCNSQGKNHAAFVKHFNQWFDGFRTLKLIHGLRDAGWHSMTLKELAAADHQWPTKISPENLQESRDRLLNHWQWEG